MSPQYTRPLLSATDCLWVEILLKDNFIGEMADTVAAFYLETRNFPEQIIRAYLMERPQNNENQA